MPPRRSCSLRLQSVYLLIISLVLGSTSSPFEPDEIGSSPQIQDLFLNPPPRECPIFQDGSTTNSFPWTNPPTCSSLIVSTSDSHTDKHQTFCIYTNSAFHNGRGISIITTPETAAELSFETWDQSTGASSQSTNSSLWEAKPTPDKGIGLFAKKLLPPGETLVQLNPLLIVHPSVLRSTSPSRLELLERAVSQLPPSSRSLVENLSRRGGASPLEDIVNINAIRAKIWNLTSYLLIVPEVAVRFIFPCMSLTIQISHHLFTLQIDDLTNSYNSSASTTPAAPQLSTASPPPPSTSPFSH